ncbi:MAG: hypothetical protein ACFE0O_14480 [Opitutales bacterium]
MKKSLIALTVFILVNSHLIGFYCITFESCWKIDGQFKQYESEGNQIRVGNFGNGAYYELTRLPKTFSTFDEFLNIAKGENEELLDQIYSKFSKQIAKDTLRVVNTTKTTSVEGYHLQVSTIVILPMDFPYAKPRILKLGTWHSRDSLFFLEMAFDESVKCLNNDLFNTIKEYAKQTIECHE